MHFCQEEIEDQFCLEKSDAAGQRGLFAGPEFGTGTKIPKDNGVRLFGPRGNLRLKKRGEEEALSRCVGAVPKESILRRQAELVGARDEPSESFQ